jgi:hypothetical protein
MSSVRGHDVAGTDKSMLKGVVIFADNMSFLPKDFFTDLGNSNDDVKTCMFEINGYENAFYIVFDDDSHALFKLDDRGKLNKKRLEDNFHVICFCSDCLRIYSLELCTICLHGACKRQCIHVCVCYIWGIIYEKAWTKVKGNYLNAAGGFN